MSASTFYEEGVKSWKNLNVNSITATDFNFASYTDQFVYATGLGKNYILGDQDVEGLVISGGTLSGLDPVTGIFTAPSNGLYSINLEIGATVAGSVRFGLNSYDPVAGINTSFGSSGSTSVATSNYPNGAFQLSFIANLATGRQVKHNVSLGGPATVNVSIRIVRLFETL